MLSTDPCSADDREDCEASARGILPSGDIMASSSASVVLLFALSVVPILSSMSLQPERVSPT